MTQAVAATAYNLHCSDNIIKHVFQHMLLVECKEFVLHSEHSHYDACHRKMADWDSVKKKTVDYELTIKNFHM